MRVRVQRLSATRYLDEYESPQKKWIQDVLAPPALDSPNIPSDAAPDSRPLLRCRKPIHVMAGGAARRHARQTIENLYGGFPLRNAVSQMIHILVDRHAHLFKRQG